MCNEDSPDLAFFRSRVAALAAISREQLVAHLLPAQDGYGQASRPSDAIDAVMIFVDIAKQQACSDGVIVSRRSQIFHQGLNALVNTLMAEKSLPADAGPALKQSFVKALVDLKPK